MQATTRSKPKKDYEKIYYLFELSIVGSGLPAATREYRFFTHRQWRIDFAWPEKHIMLALEIEGGAYIQGRHTRGASFVADMKKYNELAIAGFSLLRFTPEQVERGEALAVVERWFKTRSDASKID